MFHSIQHIDESILRLIHINYGNAFFDWLMPMLRNPYFWAPLYLFILVFMWRNYGKQGLWWCLVFIATFAFCDFTSASILKPFFHRIRPCNNEELGYSLRHLIRCGSGFSFPSSHASNHIGFFVFIAITCRHLSKWIVPFAVLWAISVCYAQMYVGAHYPSDILGGALLGSFIGWFNGNYFLKRYGKLANSSTY